MVTKTSELGIIPCLVTDPRINVTLYERDSGAALQGHFLPTQGFQAALEDRTYVCRGELDGQEKESQAFYVFSIVGRCSVWTYSFHKRTIHTAGLGTVQN